MCLGFTADGCIRTPAGHDRRASLLLSPMAIQSFTLAFLLLLRSSPDPQTYHVLGRSFVMECNPTFLEDRD